MSWNELVELPNKQSGTIAVATRDMTASKPTVATSERNATAFSPDKSHWEEMHRAAEQKQPLTSQVEEELRQLRDYHDRTRPLEGEYGVLRRRFEDQETKLADLDRTMATILQTVSRAAAEWEKRAKETDAKINNMRSQLEEASSAKTQLDFEVSLLKVHLQKKELDERLTRDRESKLRDKVTTLEKRIARLEAVGESKPPVVAPTVTTQATDNYKFERPACSESQTSTVDPQRHSTTPVDTKTRRAQLASNGVWSSIHNPYLANSVPHRMPNRNGSSTPKRDGLGIRPAFPVESVASVAPDVDDEGWWS